MTIKTFFEDFPSLKGKVFEGKYTIPLNLYVPLKTVSECCIDKQTIKVVILDVLTEEGCYSIGAGVILRDKLFKKLGLE